MEPIKYLEKTATVTFVGEPKSKFPSGQDVTIKTKDGRQLPAVSVSAKFDFEPDVWYSAILFENQLKTLVKDKEVKIKIWSKEKDGKIYKNFAIINPEKPDVGALEARISKLENNDKEQDKKLVTLHDLVKTSVPSSTVNTTQSEDYDIDPSEIPF